MCGSFSSLSHLHTFIHHEHLSRELCQSSLLLSFELSSKIKLQFLYYWLWQHTLFYWMELHLPQLRDTLPQSWFWFYAEAKMHSQILVIAQVCVCIYVSFVFNCNSLSNNLLLQNEIRDLVLSLIEISLFCRQLIYLVLMSHSYILK